MKAEDREGLVGLIRTNPTAEIVLPEEFYAPGSTVIRTEIDGIKQMLHRWLYVQLTGIQLGRDRLRRKPEHDPRNVNPLLMERVAPSDPIAAEKCPNGHTYAETGEFPPGRSDGRRCVQCWKDMTTRANESARIGGLDAGSANREKTHCKFGHEYTPENTLYWPGDKGRRRCRQCEADRSKKRWNERKSNASTKES